MNFLLIRILFFKADLLAVAGNSQVIVFVCIFYYIIYEMVITI